MFCGAQHASLIQARTQGGGGGSDRSEDPPNSTKVHFFSLLIPVGLLLSLGDP